MNKHEPASSVSTLQRRINRFGTDLATIDVPGLAEVMYCSVSHVHRLLSEKKGEMPPPRRAPGGHKIFFLASEVAEWLKKLPSTDSPTRRTKRPTTDPVAST